MVCFWPTEEDGLCAWDVVVVMQSVKTGPLGNTECWPVALFEKLKAAS